MQQTSSTFYLDHILNLRMVGKPSGASLEQTANLTPPTTNSAKERLERLERSLGAIRNWGSGVWATFTAPTGPNKTSREKQLAGPKQQKDVNQVVEKPSDITIK